MRTLKFRKPYPTKITIDAHTACNATCTICPYPKLTRQISHGIMEWGLFQKVLGDFQDICRRYRFVGTVSFCNMSEPTILRNFFDYLKYVHDRKFNVYFNTNVSYLTPTFVDRLISEKVFCGIHLNILSLEKEKYEEIMGLKFDPMMTNLKYLAGHYPTSLLDVGFEKTLMTNEELKEARIFFKGLGIKVYEYIARDRAQNLIDKTHPITEMAYGCLADRPIYRMMVAYDGRVYLCDEDMAQEVIFGDLRKQAIEEVWNGAALKKILEVIYGEQRGEKNFLCYRCVNAKTTPNFEWGSFFKRKEVDVEP